MNFVGPAGLSSHAEKSLEPLQLMVHAQTDSAGRFFAAGMLSPSDCYPVGPDDCLPVLESCEHLVPDYADPVGQLDAESDTAEPL